MRVDYFSESQRLHSGLFVFECMFWSSVCNSRLPSLLPQFCTKTGMMWRPFTVKSFALFRMAASKRRWMSWTLTQRCSAGKQSPPSPRRCFATCFFRRDGFARVVSSAVPRKHVVKMLLSKIFSEVVFEKAYCEYRLNRVESSLKTIEGAAEQTDKLKELYGQVVRLHAKPKATKCYCLKRVIITLITSNANFDRKHGSRNVLTGKLQDFHLFFWGILAV